MPTKTPYDPRWLLAGRPNPSECSCGGGDVSWSVLCQGFVKDSCLLLLCQWSNFGIKLLILLMVAYGIIGITKPGELKYISKWGRRPRVLTPQIWVFLRLKPSAFWSLNLSAVSWDALDLLLDLKYSFLPPVSSQVAHPVQLILKDKADWDGEKAWGLQTEYISDLINYLVLRDLNVIYKNNM